MKQPNTHGGARPNSGRRPKDPDGPRKVVQFCLSPANAAYLKQMGKAKNDWLNSVIDGERNELRNDWGVPTE